MYRLFNFVKLNMSIVMIFLVLITIMIAAIITLNINHSKQAITENYNSDVQLNLEKINDIKISDDYILHDKERNRDIPLKIYYPNKVGVYPVIIVSHGMGGSKNGLSYLGKYWAQNGFVSIHPTHFGSDASAFDRLKDAEDPLYQLKVLSNPDNTTNRPLDITFIINSFKDIERLIPGIGLNEKVVGVAGHSFGANTTLLIAGMEMSSRNGRTINFRDERVKVFIALSPQGESRLNSIANPWHNINSPVMVMTGTKDESSRTQKDYEWRTEAYNNLPEKDKFLLILGEATHQTFAGNGRTSSLNSDHLKCIQEASLQFLNAYLLNDMKSMDYLKSNKLVEKQNFKLDYSFK